MNTTEKIVESYFRLCKDCFTLPDVKVIKGNNRQIDLLAYYIKGSVQYHIEVSVTHCENWCPTAQSLESEFEKKFFGSPAKREGKNTDYTKGKAYADNIDDTYKKYGMDPQHINRIWVCWTVKVEEEDKINKMILRYSKDKEICKPIELLKFRDKIIPDLLNEVSTSHYEDDSLRTLSLLRQFERQKKL